MSKKTSRPAWFKMFAHQKPLIDSVPDETAGKALKAAFRYFDTQDEINDLDPLSLAVYAAIKPYIDEAFADYTRDVLNGKMGGRPKRKPGVTHPNYQLPPRTEADADADTEGEKEGSTAPPAASPTPAEKPKRTSYGQYGWVKLTDEQYSRLSNDLGETELKRCIDYVDEAAQSTGNKNRWRDWNLVIRRCHRDGWGLGRTAGKAVTDSKPFIYDPGDTAGSL